jgi:RNA polymerase sigma-70 factor (ECF subfamily)
MAGQPPSAYNSAYPFEPALCVAGAQPWRVSSSKFASFFRGLSMAEASASGQSGPLAERPGQTLSDRSLLRRFRNGQSDAATELYLRYAERLHVLVAGQCAPDLAPRVGPEDIVQSVFRTFFRRVARGQYDVPEGEELWQLFLVIALHKVRSMASFHRAAKRDVRVTTTGLSDILVSRHLVAPDEMALTSLCLVIDELLDTLPSSMRAIVELRIEGREVEEIVARTQRSRRSVERALQEFRARLRDVICEDA